MAKFYALCEMENSKPEIYYRILNEAMTLIKKHGIRFVTMDLIAENLGISKKTIYVHFRNKKSLISETVKKRLEEQEIAFEEIDRKAKISLKPWLWSWITERVNLTKSILSLLKS